MQEVTEFVTNLYILINFGKNKIPPILLVYTFLERVQVVYSSPKYLETKTSQKIKKLEQETTAWKGKYESSEKTLLNIVKVKEDLEEKLKKSNLRAEAI